MANLDQLDEKNNSSVCTELLAAVLHILMAKNGFEKSQLRNPNCCRQWNNTLWSWLLKKKELAVELTLNVSRQHLKPYSRTGRLPFMLGELEKHPLTYFF